MRSTLLLFLVAALTGCSNMGDYYKSVDQTNIRAVEAERARAEADQARYMALARIAESGDATAKVAAAMALAVGSSASLRTGLIAPSQPQNEALQWASILVPGITQGLGIRYNAMTAINASNNATQLGISTNAAFTHFGSEISKLPLVVQQPAPVIVEQPAPVIVEQPDPIIVNGTVP